MDIKLYEITLTLVQKPERVIHNVSKSNIKCFFAQLVFSHSYLEFTETLVRSCVKFKIESQITMFHKFTMPLFLIEFISEP